MANKPSISNQELAESVFSDFSSFFQSEFPIHYQLSEDISFGALDLDEKILLSESRYSKHSSNFQEVFYLLLIICHELAHLSLDHIDAEYQIQENRQAIEGMADYWGSRLCLSLILFGPKTSSIIAKFSDLDDIEYATNGFWMEIGQVLQQFHRDVFKASTHYPSPSTRIHLYTYGIFSFLTRLDFCTEEGKYNFPPKSFIVITKCLVKGAGSTAYEQGKSYDKELIKLVTNICDVHTKLKGKLGNLEDRYECLLSPQSPYPEYSKKIQDLNNQTQKLLEQEVAPS